MSQRSFTDTLIPFEAFNRIFVFRTEIDFFPRGNSIAFGQKRPNFEVGSFQLFMSLGISACRKTPLGIRQRIFCVTLTQTSSFVGHFFVPCEAYKVAQGTFFDTLFRLEAFKRIFVFRPKFNFFPRGKSMVFGQK